VLYKLDILQDNYLSFFKSLKKVPLLLRILCISNNFFQFLCIISFLIHNLISMVLMLGCSSRIVFLALFIEWTNYLVDLKISKNLLLFNNFDFRQNYYYLKFLTVFCYKYLIFYVNGMVLFISDFLIFCFPLKNTKKTIYCYFICFEVKHYLNYYIYCR
jgi:hypothetical protein